MAELSAQPTSVQTVYSWVTNEKLYVNRRYQRKLVWTLLEKQKLIESILKKYPIPAVLLAEREGQSGVYEIIDGLQRLHAITSFIEGQFSTLDNRYFDVSQFATAKANMSKGKFNPVDVVNVIGIDEVSIILDYSLAFSIMRDVAEGEVNDVFSRINTYGHQLSEQERRQAGVQSSFSNLVRKVSCMIRGDRSGDTLLLNEMPVISIDLPKSNHGYQIKAEDVFWVKHGVLRSTDLRDSDDEQCVADIIACILSGKMINRSKSELDAIYGDRTIESNKINAAIEVYGESKLQEEFNFCLDEIGKISGDSRLKDVIFVTKNSNPFPAIFAQIFLAVYDLIIREGKEVADYEGARRALTGLSKSLDTTRTGGVSDERQKAVNSIKGLVSPFFVESDNKSRVYSNHSVVDIEDLIRRSEVELSDYELKQGFLPLVKNGRDFSAKFNDKILHTIVAIANNGKGRIGKLVFGIADNKVDANKVRVLDSVEPRECGRRFVVGVNREAVSLGLTTEEYFNKVLDIVRNSSLSEPLKSSVLSHVDYHNFHGLGIIIFTIPPQGEVSYCDGKLYRRDGDATKLVSDLVDIVHVVNRFK